ncbi:MAG: hypothetical protein NTW64_00540 [Candidatus Omnitrophica bacterium]|nr:hypothetical protein [Candidatus Omnitrophota bacterium]
MNHIFVFAIITIGASGIVAQVLILRELLVSFYGNELILGIILANWVILEASGVYLVGKAIDKIKNKISLFFILQIAFSISLPLSVYLSRAFKSVLGIPFGEGIGIPAIFWVSFFVILLPGFCHGALFSTLTKLFSLPRPLSPIGRVYALETIGTIIGGVILTYLFIPYLTSFQIAFIIVIANLATCLFFFNSLQKNTAFLKYLVLIALVFFIFLSGNSDKIQRFSVKKQLGMQEVLDYRNSVYGNIAVVKKEGQYTFFHNGTPVITAPYPDITFVEEFGNLPLLFHPEPKDALILSAGAGGLINEMLKYPLKSIDYAELDPTMIKMLKKYPTDLTNRELSDNRVNIKYGDARFFVKATPNKYDLVLIGVSNPSDLSSNRLFTQEFFSLAEKKLSPGGILALWLPGSLTYLSKQLRDLNFSVLNALKDTYSYVRIIPGDYNIYLASNDESMLKVSPDLITERMLERNIKTNILIPSYLDYRLDKRWLEWFIKSSVGATKKINKDYTPFAVYQMLILWNKQFTPKLANILEILGSLNLKVILLAIFALTVIFFRHKQEQSKFSIAYCIATTGFFGMLINLVLIFSFQVVYGYLYYAIGMLISVFMAGIAGGSIFMSRRIEKIKNRIKWLISLEAGVIIFSFLIAIIILEISSHTGFTFLIFLLLFFISGLLMGLEFPLAAKIYSKESDKVGATVGLLYGSDLIGGWVAAIFGGIIFLPILGLFNTCMVIVALKLGSLGLLVVANRR